MAGVVLENCQDGWIRNCTFNGMRDSALRLEGFNQRINVDGLYVANTPVAVSVQGRVADSRFQRISHHPVLRQKIGRNDPCWCGSGRKFKKCCLP